VVRSDAKAAPFQRTFASFVTSGHLTFVVVPDMTISGAFNEALKEIDGVMHVASPMPPMDPKTDPEIILGPAVKMTLGILEDAAKVSSVKRVVITSSVVTLYEPKEGKYVYSEVCCCFSICLHDLLMSCVQADWFDTAPKLVKQYGVEASGGIKYIASKVLAERAAWDFVEKNKPSYEFVAVLPPWVWGVCNSPSFLFRFNTADIFHSRPEICPLQLRTLPNRII
jgi:nucleoside-diphosphate-sugar epimerase